MKKMMIIVAVVAMSFAAQAAKFNWGITQPGALSSTLNGQTLYLVKDATLGGMDTAALALITGSFTTGNVLAGGDFSFLSLTLAGAGADTKSGVIFTPGGAYPAVGNGQSFYAFVIAADGQSLWYSTVKTGNVTTANTVATTLYFDATSFTKVEIVPEPTSMALLALGGAVFGLRRKFRK